MKGINFKKLFLLRASKAFGVDFNGRTLRLMQLKKRGKNQKVAGWVDKKIPQGIMKEMLIEDEDEFKNFFLEAIKKAEGKIHGNRVVVSLPENKVFIRIITIPLMEEGEAGESVRFETESNIPISVDEVYFDWQIVERREKDMDVLVVASPMRIIDNYLKVFSKMGYQIVVFEPKSISTGRSIIDASIEEYALVVDMGLGNTNFAIYEKGFPIFTSSGSISGKILTDMVMKAKGISIEKAESYKIKIGLGSTPEEKQESFLIFESALLTFVDEIKRTINFFHETLATQKNIAEKKELKISKVILTGGGANLKGLNSYLSINLQETIEQSNSWINIKFKNDIPPISREDSQGFSTVIGLALRAQDYENYN